MTDRFKTQQGFLTFAQNSPTTDYLNLAYCQALSIKATQTINSYAVIVDAATNTLITDKHRKAFDHIIVLENDDAVNDDWKMKNEWQAWYLTPFKETIKVESDILFTTNIDHWWAGLQLRDVCLTTSIRNYEGNVSDNRTYRQLFDDNTLPDVYSGLMYFRITRTSKEFFDAAHTIFDNWEQYSTEVLRNYRDNQPTTDVVFAIAANEVGIELCTNPALSYPTFTHMKGAIQGWGITTDWTEKLYAQVDDDASLTVGFTRQLYPFHYQQKHFITEEIIGQYERLILDK